jgi:hypothetical protein
LILRKGGIHEGKKGFHFDHDEFFLFPTFFHEQVSRLKLPSDTPLPVPVPGEIALQLLARCVGAWAVTDFEKVKALAPFHIWAPEVVEERFNYKTPGGETPAALPSLQVAFLRVYRLSKPWTFPDAPQYGGCRSWITLPEMPAGMELLPVLEEAVHEERFRQVQTLLG